MSTTNLRLGQRVELFYILPFNLGFCTEYVAIDERRRSWQRIAELLTKEYPSRSWEVRPYPPLPGTLLDGGITIVGTAAAASPSQRYITEAIASVDIGVTLDGAVTEEVVYFEHGIGSINLCIPLRIERVEQLPLLTQLAAAVNDRLRSVSDGLAIIGDWPAFRLAMRHCFERAGVLFDMWGILSQGGEGRGQVSCVSQNFLLYAEPNGAIAVDSEELPALLTTMTGLLPEDNGNIVPNSPGFAYLAEGWDGQVAVLSDRKREPWLKFMWLFATCYWAALSDLDLFLYQQTRQLARRHHVSAAEAKRTMEAIQRIEHAVATLAHETVPTNVWDTAEQLAVHQGIYDSWESQSLMQSIREKLEHMTSYYSSLNDLLANSAQERMNIVMTTFTFLTFAGVLADCISSVDFNGSALSTPRRLVLILMGTLSCILFSVLVGLLYQRRRPTQ